MLTFSLILHFRNSDIYLTFYFVLPSLFAYLFLGEMKHGIIVFSDKPNFFRFINHKMKLDFCFTHKP